VTFKVLALVVEQFFTRLLNLILYKILGQQMWNFYTFLLQIHSGICLQKIGILDLSLIKLLQNEQGCNFLPHSVFYDKSASFRPYGRLFHSPGPAAANALSPKILYLPRHNACCSTRCGTYSRRLRESMTSRKSSAKHEGEMPESDRCKLPQWAPAASFGAFCVLRMKCPAMQNCV